MNEDKLNFLTPFQRYYFNYFRYHHNPVNLRIHYLVIPLITITFMKLVDYICYNIINMGLLLGYYILSLIFGTIYIYVDLISGLVTTSIYFTISFLIGTNFEYIILGINEVYWYLIIQFVSWILLFIGHDCYEGRRQSIFREFSHYFLSPAFITVKIMEIMLDYKKAEIEEVMKLIEEDLEKYKSKRE
jgi:uncharacterized membrane protein YGL010W